jgi:hypothetical protein
VVLAQATLIEDARVIDDAALLDGAAAVWAVVSFAAEIPATPEQREAMRSAQQTLLGLMREVGLDEDDVTTHLKSRVGAGPEAPGGRRLRSLLPD